MEKANAEPVMGTDRGFDVTPRESEQTSIRSFFTRELAELLKEEIANEREIVCIFQRRYELGNHRLGESSYVC
jgi:hypothetical protein